MQSIVRSELKDGIPECRSKDLMVAAGNLQDFPSLESGNLSLRKPTKGTEYEMVDKYVRSALLIPEPGKEKVIFLEPQVDSTFPDIVVVYFEPEVAKKWSYRRTKLIKADLRILHYISSEETVERTKLKSVFPSNSSKSLKRLLDAELIDYEADTWKARPLQETFAVQRLIAIEAKVRNWQDGLQQSFNNTWFASESYLLLPSLPRTNDLVQEAKHLGVGLLTAECSFLRSKLPSKTSQLPKSYVSWLFNEWAWQAWLNTKGVE